MFDKWKARRVLYKVCNNYYKKYWKTKNINEALEYRKIACAITYALCKYLGFNYNLYYEFLPWDFIKWDIAYNYIKYYDECKEAYETIVKNNNELSMHLDDIYDNPHNFDFTDILYDR